MKYTYLIIAPFLAILIFLSCANDTTNESAQKDENSLTEEESSPFAAQLSSLKLPKGFTIEIYASDVPNARSMAMGSNGILFVGNKDEGNVYALEDTDGDNKVDKKYTIAKGLNMPNGVAFKDGSLFVAEVNKLWRYDNIEANLSNPAAPTLIYDDYPTDKHHGWKYIAFGPDGKLYVPVGAPCNICESKDEIYASITRMNPDGSGREVFVKGVRNSVGLTWHPESGDLWFTDNGRDMLGNDMPSCELNKATKKGEHFGYPYCHAGDIGDPEFGAKFSCDDFVQPQRKLGPHVAPLGLKFYTGSMFPAGYSGNLFVAKHGSWNRSRKIGYSITHVKIENGKAVDHEEFISGWLDEDEQEAWGRPVDVLVKPDGSLLISDDKAGVIYRVTYAG